MSVVEFTVASIVVSFLVTYIFISLENWKTKRLLKKLRDDFAKFNNLNVK